LEQVSSKVTLAVSRSTSWAAIVLASPAVELSTAIKVKERTNITKIDNTMGNILFISLSFSFRNSGYKFQTSNFKMNHKFNAVITKVKREKP